MFKRMILAVAVLAMVVGSSAGVLAATEGTASANAVGAIRVVVGDSTSNGQVEVWGNSDFDESHNVWYGVQDLTTGAWYGGWTVTGSTCHWWSWGGGPCYNASFVADVTDIPLSDCTHQFRADATDATTNTASNEVRFTLTCASHPIISVTQLTGQGASFVPYGQIQLTGMSAKPDTDANLWYGAQDLATGVWYGGWTSPDAAGNFAWTSTNIPASACGHPFRAEATDNEVTPHASSNKVSFTLFCGPALAFDDYNTVHGNYFLQLHSVRLTVNGPSGVVLSKTFTLAKTNSFVVSLPAGAPACGLTATALDLTNGQTSLVAANRSCIH